MTFIQKNFFHTYCSSLLIITISMIFLISCTKNNEQIDRGNVEMKIGSVLPLTGDLAIYGQKMKKGIDLAVKQINSEDGINGSKIKILYEDDHGDPKTSVTAVQKLITYNKVPVIIGGAISATALPSVPIADKNNTVLFSPAATNPKLTGMSKFFFRNWPSDIYDGTAMGKFTIQELKINKAAILFVNNEWGVAISDIYAKTFKKYGGQILVMEKYDQNATDFRTQLSKIKGYNPDAIYIPGYLKELINILKQKKEMGINATILSAYGFYDPKILELAKDAAEGAIFTVPIYDATSSDPIIKKYVEHFKNEYGDTPDIWSAQAYDAMKIIAMALQNKAVTGAEIRNEIAQIKNFKGVSGTTSFDKNGDVQKPLKFMTVHSGNFVDY